MKLCPKCQKRKTLEEFHNNRQKEDGKAYYCKSCSNAFTRRHRADYPEKQREYTKKWRAENPEKHKAQTKRHYIANREKLLQQGRIWRETHPDQRFDAYLRRRFGILHKQYQQMLSKQSGCCAICYKTPAQNGKRLAVDHCHETGIVRGLLCATCNKALGLFADSCNMLRRAAYYLEESCSQNST